MPKSKLISAAVWAVDAYDQVNTGHAIENLCHRGEILDEAINALRVLLNQREKKTTLTIEQVKG